LVPSRYQTSIFRRLVVKLKVKENPPLTFSFDKKSAVFYFDAAAAAAL
jgi:hypothetical protein